MAASFTAGGVTLSLPTLKVFTIDVPEDDAINTPTVLDFGLGGMRELCGTPLFWYVTEITTDGAAPSAICTIAIPPPTRFGFTVNKTSVAGGALVHRFVVYMSTKSPTEL